MDEIFRQVVITLRGMWRYRWLGLAIAWIVGAVGAVVVSFIPEKYEASARIFVNTASILKPLMVGMTVQPNDDQRITMLSRVVISRPNVEKLLQLLKLDQDAKTKDEFERLMDKTAKALDIKSTGRDNLYTLTYRDVQADRAKAGVEQFASMFIESGQGGKVGETEAAKKFIDEQILVYEKKLQDAENRLKNFKLRYLGMSPGEGAGYFARLSETSTLLNRAQLELREAENSRDALRKGLSSFDEQISNVESTPSATATLIVEVNGRIDAQKRNLDTLLQRYTDSHPDVVGARRIIRELEDQRRALIAERKNEPVTSVATTPVGPRASEQLKVSLANAEALVASLRTRVAEYSGRYNQLKSSASLMPQLEAEFAQLNRDYDVNKKNYENLVSRRESVNISGDMQSVSGVVDFRLIDPPRVSPGPVAPNHRMLFAAACFLALAAGLASAFVAHEIRPTFYDRRSLSEATGLPILGAVSLVVSEPARVAQRNSNIRLLAGIGLLFVAFAVVHIGLKLAALRMV
jgi:polysaccharide chain length determinant protein (PEP-CTERM system associated)